MLLNAYRRRVRENGSCPIEFLRRAMHNHHELVGFDLSLVLTALSFGMPKRFNPAAKLWIPPQDFIRSPAV